MAIYPYTRNRPASQNNPSNDQGDMRTNTNSTDSLLAEDHYSFGVPNGGLHKQTRIIDGLAIPAGLASGMGTLYTKLATSTSPSTESSLFYTPGATTNEYQLTRTITASFALFGENTNNYNSSGVGKTGGWTFLPGGLLFQYGLITTVAQGQGSANLVQFPVGFSSGGTNGPYSITLTPVANDNKTNSVRIVPGSVTTTQFRIHGFDISSSIPVYWQAVGK